MTKQVKNELINCNGLSARIELINIKNGTLHKFGWKIGLLYDIDNRITYKMKQ